MRLRAAWLLLALCLGGCKPNEEENHLKAIVGAVLIDGRGGPPLSNSAIVIGGDRVREVGEEAAVTIPDGADRLDGSGKFVVPMPLDVYPGAGKDQRPDHATHLFHADKAAMAAARDAGSPLIGHISTQADVAAMVDGGAIGFIGMIADTEDLDPKLLARLRDLRIFFAPALVSQGAALQIAQRNTHRLYAAGVPIALASNGGDPAREPELLEQAGIPPLDVIVAATHNSAAALGQSKDAGTVEAGKRADLLLLSANPGDDIGNLRKVVLRITAGNWIKP